MKIFILEDSNERIKQFKKRFFKEELYIERDVKAAIKLFKGNYPFDVIFLDHDLGGEEMVDSNDNNTGYQFVKWMVENYKVDGTDIIVHSLNPQGADRMIFEMKEHGVRSRKIPFISLF